MPICMRYKNDEHDAVSALNIVFVKLIDKVHTKAENVAFDHWAKRIMINQLIDEYRKDKKLRERQLSVDPTTLPTFKNQPITTQTDESIDSELIILAIQELKEPGRTIFNLHAIEGYSHQEIAKKLDMRIDNCRYHLHSARKLLRNKLAHLVTKSNMLP